MHINSATHQKRVHYAAVVTWQQWKLLDAMITTIGWVSLFWTHDFCFQNIKLRMPRMMSSAWECGRRGSLCGRGGKERPRNNNV